MTTEQLQIFAIFGVVFAALVWGRIRYDLVAFSALILAALLGHVPSDEVFSGFGHPAVAIIALVLIVSRALGNSGAIELIAGRILDHDRSVPGHIAILSAAGAGLSAIINNVAALALLMPLDMEAARKAGRAISLSLMPLSFATILGGMITLIGTPPNIVIAEYRQDALGAPFSMFDFAPVGLTVAAAGIAFLALVAWRLLPDRAEAGGLSIRADRDHYIAELRVADASAQVDQPLAGLDDLAEDADLNVIGLVRRGRRLPGLARRETLRAGDFVVVEGDPVAIEAFMGKAGLEFAGSEKHAGRLTDGSLSLTEAIIPDGARIVGRTARGVKLLHRHSVTLLGVSRNGRRFRDRVRLLRLRAGDVVLLLGSPERVEAATAFLGVLPLEGRRHGVIQRRKAGLAIGVFALAILVTVLNLTSLPVALAACVAAYVALGLVGGQEVYEAVEWKVVVLLASLIPLAGAFEASGGATLLAGGLAQATAGWPGWVGLLALMAVTMTLSDFLNNVATTLIAAPVAVEMASATQTNPDSWLMAVAVAASCAFLTPIGHKNNTIIMGPGGYRFGDYWPLGLPLELLVLAVATPAILVFWPL